MAHKSPEDRRKYYREYYQKHKKKIQDSTNKYKKNNPDKVKSWMLRGRYGLSVEEFESLGSCCAICSSEDNLCIDHCHDTDKVRGILCRQCNLALGHFNDDSVRLLKAVEYLNGTCGV